MSLWQDYQKNRNAEVLIADVTASMRPALFNWLHQVADQRLTNPYGVAVEIKNTFRIDAPIPRTRPNNYLEAPPEYKFAQFIMNVAYEDAPLFFTILDYLVQTYLTRDTYPDQLEAILAQAGHKYAVQDLDGKKIVAERLPADQRQLLEHVLENENVYASEFRDAFAELYGTNPNYTHSAGESFQAAESALKFYLGEDKGQNLGAILNWLKNNPGSWVYSASADGQTDASEQFVSLVNFINKSYRKTKHGQADKKLEATKEQAEVMIRMTALLIFQLENVIAIVPDKT